MGRLTFLLIVFLGLLGLSACSPYVYKDEIGSFADGVHSVTGTFESGRSAILAEETDNLQMSEISSKARLDLLDGCDSPDPVGKPPKLKNCGIVKWGETELPPPSGLSLNLAKAEPVFRSLNNYVTALAAITNAADAASLAQAGQSLAATAAGLTDELGKLGAPGASEGTLIDASEGMLTEFATLYLDSRRYAKLKKVVPLVDKHIETLGGTVQAALSEIRAHQIRVLQRDLHRASSRLIGVGVSTLSDGDYRADLASTQGKIDALNAARASDPGAVVSALISAHHKLAAALNDGDRQSLAVYQAAKGFLDAATKLQSAVQPSKAGAGS